jgi:hypothetical protein
MTPRRVAILLGAGVVVIGFAMWVASKRHLDRATHAGDLVMPGLESTLNSVTEIRLAKGDETHTTLKKSATDWIVGERDYPADSGKVRKFLLDLGSLNVVEEKTHNPANYPQLGVEDVTSPKATGTRVDLVTPPKVYGLIIGKSSSAKSGYVRTPSSQLTLLAAPSLSVDADPKRWLEHTLVVSNIPKGRELSSPVAADSIAGALGGMTLDDVRKPAAPANAKVSHAIFRTFDGLELDIAGHKDGTQTFIAITPRSTSKDTEAEAQQLTAQLQGWEYEIPSYKYDGIFKPLEDLLKKPPEATPKKADAKAKKTDKKAAEKAETN